MEDTALQYQPQYGERISSISYEDLKAVFSGLQHISKNVKGKHKTQRAGNLATSVKELYGGISPETESASGNSGYILSFFRRMIYFPRFSATQPEVPRTQSKRSKKKQEIEGYLKTLFDVYKVYIQGIAGLDPTNESDWEKILYPFFKIPNAEKIMDNEADHQYRGLLFAYATHDNPKVRALLNLRKEGKLNDLGIEYNQLYDGGMALREENKALQTQLELQKDAQRDLDTKYQSSIRQRRQLEDKIKQLTAELRSKEEESDVAKKSSDDLTRKFSELEKKYLDVSLKNLDLMLQVRKFTAPVFGGVIYSFESILQIEPLILIDTGIKDYTNPRWYKDKVYYASKFSQLDKSVLEQNLGILEKFKTQLSEPTVYTTKKVVEEIGGFVDIITEKLVTLNRFENLRHERKNNRRYDKYDDSQEKKLLQELCFLYDQIYRLASHKVLKIENPKSFHGLEQIVLATGIFGGKKDFTDRYGMRTKKKAEDRHTDEELVATALYLSITEGKQSCIVTPDSDIKRLLLKTKEYLTDKKTEDNEVYLKALTKNPVRVYFMKEGGSIKLAADTSQFN